MELEVADLHDEVLHALPKMATCPQSSHTESVFSGFEQVCLLARDSALHRSTLYETSLDTLETTACMHGNPAMSYCYRINNQNNAVNYHIVLHGLLASGGNRRRLLAVSDNSFNKTWNSFDIDHSKPLSRMFAPLQTYLKQWKASREYIQEDAPTRFGSIFLPMTRSGRRLQDFSIVIDMAQLATPGRGQGSLEQPREPEVCSGAHGGFQRGHTELCPRGRTKEAPSAAGRRTRPDVARGRGTREREEGAGEKGRRARGVEEKLSKGKSFM